VTLSLVGEYFVISGFSAQDVPVEPARPWFFTPSKHFSAECCSCTAPRKEKLHRRVMSINTAVINIFKVQSTSRRAISTGSEHP
jgi:hypothetical protein